MNEQARAYQKYLAMKKQLQNILFLLETISSNLMNDCTVRYEKLQQNETRECKLRDGSIKLFHICTKI